MAPVITVGYTCMKFSDARDAVFAAKPVFKKILEEKGDLSLYDYFQGSFHSAPAIPEERKKEFIETFRKEVSRYMGSDVADSAAMQLEKNYYVSTADHHGPLTHPFFGNSALVQSFVNKAAGFHNIIVLSCGGISMDNSSFPRGFLLHDDELAEVRLHLLSRHKDEPVFVRAPYALTDYDAMMRELQASSLSGSAQQKFTNVIAPIYRDSHAFSYATYSEQISYTNFLFWKTIPEQADMNLIYLEQESFVIRLLLEHHLGKGTVLDALLNDTVWHNSFAAQFDGIDGAFSKEKNKGTFLWWSVLGGKRHAVKQDELLSGQALIDALIHRQLMPSMALTYCVLAFYYGLHCGGGFSQVNYLAHMKEAYQKMLAECGVPEKEYSFLKEVDTSFFCGEFVLADIGNGDKKVPASPYDLVVYGDKKSGSALLEKAKDGTLVEAVDALMPELYKIVTGTTVGEAPDSSYTSSDYEKETVLLLRK